MMKRIYILLSTIALSLAAHAQDNYEIQVYGSETVEKHATMLELHSNFTFDGQKQTENGVLPTNHVFHETIEITHGFTSWFEIGFYLFSTIGNEGRTNYVGSHIRPRVAVPESWKWPVGVSLSLEAGYQKPAYSTDDWTFEIRPIVDKQFKKLYVAFNPVFDRSLHGLTVNQGFTFSPNLKVSYAISKKVSPGVEYYGTTGSLSQITAYQQQQHQLFLCIDLDLSPKWEFNCGYGLGFTSSTDNGIFKMILGRKFK